MGFLNILVFCLALREICQEVTEITQIYICRVCTWIILTNITYHRIIEIYTNNTIAINPTGNRQQLVETSKELCLSTVRSLREIFAQVMHDIYVWCDMEMN